MKEIFYNIYVNRLDENCSYADLYQDYIQNIICSLRNNGITCNITADISCDKFILDGACLGIVSMPIPYIHIVAESDDMDRLDKTIEQVSEKSHLLAVEKIYNYGELFTPYDYTHRKRDTESFVDIEVRDTPKGKTILVNSSVPVSSVFSDEGF